MNAKKITYKIKKCAKEARLAIRCTDLDGMTDTEVEELFRNIIKKHYGEKSQ